MVAVEQYLWRGRGQPAQPGVAALTTIPTAFSYQGTLRDASGNLVNGTVNLSLRLYGTGIDNFSYFVSDGRGGTTAGSVTVTVGGQLGRTTVSLPLVRR